MRRYYFPAVFTPEDNGKFSVDFPDLSSCYTCGDDMADAIIMAEDVLAMTLVDYETDNLPAAPASTLTLPAPADALGAAGAAFGAALGAALGAAGAPVDAPSSTTTSYTFPFTVMV